MTQRTPQYFRDEARRRLPSEKDRERLSQIICENALASNEFKSAPTVGMFYPRSWEVNLLGIWQGRKNVVLPKVVGSTLSFFAVTSLSELRPGYAKIPEPPALQEYVWTSRDIILAPGAAFDTSGRRIGSGKGFYDRFLSSCPAKRWGVCFECQIFEEPLAQNETDVRMGALLTERGIRTFTVS